MTETQIIMCKVQILFQLMSTLSFIATNIAVADDVSKKYMISKALTSLYMLDQGSLLIILRHCISRQVVKVKQISLNCKRWRKPKGQESERQNPFERRTWLPKIGKN